MTEYGNRDINFWYNESIEKNLSICFSSYFSSRQCYHSNYDCQPCVNWNVWRGVAASSSIGNVALSQFSGVVTRVSALFTTTFFKHNQDTQNKEKTYKKKEDEDKKQ